MSEPEDARSDGVSQIIEQWRDIRPELDVSSLEVLGRLHRSFLLYRAAIGKIFAEYGTNEAGFDVLACLRRSEGGRRTAGELARQTLVTTGGLTLRVNRLNDAGLVVRERDDKSDSRVVHVRITDKGSALVDRIADAHFENSQKMLSGLNSKKRESLAGLLADLELSLREYQADSD